jgi:hypothetical protein
MNSAIPKENQIGRSLSSEHFKIDCYVDGLFSVEDKQDPKIRSLTNFCQ